MGTPGHALVAFLAAMVVCFLAMAAPSPAPKSSSGEYEYAMRAAQALFEETMKERRSRRCSSFFVLDEGSTVNVNKMLESEYQGSDGTAIFKVVGGRVSDTNLTDALHSRAMSQVHRLRLLSWCVTVVVMSNDPSFLAAFAEASDNERLLLWETRLLVITSLDMPLLRRLLQDYWSFSMMNAMFLTSKAEENHERCQLYVHLPYSPAGAQVVRVGSWSTAHGLIPLDGYTFFPEKYNNFHSMSINVTWFPMPPYFEEIESHLKTNQMASFTGRGYRMLEVIAEALNFTINVMPFENWNVVRENIISRKAFIRPIKLAILPRFEKLYDFTMFIERATLGFTMTKPTIKPNWQSLSHPLQPEVWGSVVATVLLAFIVLMWMNSSGENKESETWLVVRQVVGTLLDEAITGELPRKSSTRVMLTAWLIFSFIVGTVYRSNLTASLTAPKYPRRAETLADLVATGAKIAMPPDMVNFVIGFKKSDSKLFKAVSERAEFVASFKEGIEQVSHKHKAYIYERLNMKALIAEHFTNQRGFTPLYVARDNILAGYCGWPLAPNTPFKTHLDRYIMDFHGGGLIEKWTTLVLEKAGFDSRQRQSKTEESSSESLQDTDKVTMALTLVHMQGPLFLFIAGALLSLAVFLGENAVKFYSFRQISCRSESNNPHQK
ncbi:uncharacterized protein LOC135108640 isoform X2 [Scylla paramamosain]|uniref:uncharacterized protein LOC135108640 isoform X2 n=2 Tax=Scylla paramamosain TaxID=85552 RepID=UPI0030837DBF